MVECSSLYEIELMSTWWFNWMKDMRHPRTTFPNNDGNISLTGYIRDIPIQNVPHFQLHFRSKSGIVGISRDMDTRPSSNFNGKSMVWGAVGNNMLALCWSQWLLQVQFTFVLRKSLGYLHRVPPLALGGLGGHGLKVEVICNLVIWLHSHQEKTSWYHHMLFWMWLGCHGFPNDVFHMDVDSCHVSTSCLARCWEGDVAFSTNQGGG